MWRRALRDVLEFCAPVRCAGCDLPRGDEVSGDRRACAFCPACAPLLEWVRPGALGEGVHAAVYYGGPAADAIRRFKYEERTDLAGPMGALLSEVAVGWAPPVDVVVPVPLHPARLRARGYNQAALLAVPVARALGVKVAWGAVERARPTPPQVGLSREERACSVQHAFRARRSLAGQRCLIIDDIRTTGATTTALAQTLHQSGAHAVSILTWGQDPPF